MDIRANVRRFITTNFYVDVSDTLGDEDSLLDRGIVDSTGVLEVIAFIEETFDIEVKDSEMLPENLDSIARITTFLQRRRSDPVAA